MYITVMDFSTSTVTTLACDFELTDGNEIESLLECCGYHLSQISYMTSDEEPEVSTVEISDILSDEVLGIVASPKAKVIEKDLFSQ